MRVLGRAVTSKLTLRFNTYSRIYFGLGGMI